MTRRNGEEIMRSFLLTAAATAAMIVGGLTFTETAEARPWRYYRAPAVRYYRPYYAYSRPYYGYRSYYGPYYGSYYYGRPYVSSRVYYNWW
jgi:hypothetical protein